jgi:hypothetical protein
VAHRYLLTANVLTDDADLALDAANSIGSLVDERCIVIDREARPIARSGVAFVAVTFLAAGDGEADDIRERVQRLPGLPPIDAVKTRVMKRNVSDDVTTEGLNQ